MAGNVLLTLYVKCGQRRERRSFPMTLVNRVSVVTAYIAFAFVGAIVLGGF